MPNVQQTINTNKVYEIPQNISVIRADSKILIVSIDTANWIVLNNDTELAVFEMLKKRKTIHDALASFAGEYVKPVLLQMEAKDFCSQKVNVVNSQNSIYIYLTKKCNLYCPHCYMFASEPQKEELTYEKYIQLFHALKDSNIDGITFTGGEPTVHDDCVKIFCEAKKTGFKVLLLTNGITESNKRLSISEYIDEVQISIDGFDETSNAIIRGRNHFSMALESADFYLNHNIKTTVAITPPRELLPDSFEKYILFAQQLKAKYEGKSFYIKFTSSLIDGRFGEISKEDNSKYEQAVNKIITALDRESELHSFIINHRKCQLLRNCGYGGITIDSNGNIYFCNRIYECPCYGNIRRMNIHDIVILSQEITAITSVDNIEPCKDCAIRYICGGGCRIAYFPQLIANASLDKTVCHKRYCGDDVKSNYYRLMIESNRFLFRRK